MKYVTSDYVVNPTAHANLGFQGSNGSMPHSGKFVNRRVYFSFCLYFYVLAHLHSSHCSRSQEHC